jgi:hypothetical protein
VIVVDVDVICLDVNNTTKAEGEGNSMNFKIICSST